MDDACIPHMQTPVCARSLDGCEINLQLNGTHRPLSLSVIPMVLTLRTENKALESS